MDAKLFKTFTPVVNMGTSKSGVQRIFSDLESREAYDPSGSQWRAMGFIRPIEGDEFLLPLDGAGYLACVQINERNLPGAVIREKVIEKALATEELTGRKVGKKELGQLRDEVELELLPKAFIKRKLVPIMFIGKRVFVFSGSGTVVDNVLSLLVAVAEMDDMFKPYMLADLVEKNIDSELTILAKDGQSETTAENDNGGGDYDEINYLSIGNTGLLRGPNKQKITISEKDIASDDISTLLESDQYTVMKLGLEYFHAGETEPNSSFILNDKLVFSKFLLNGVTSVRGKGKEDATATLIGTAWLAAKGIESVVETVIGVMGGLRATAKPKDEEQISMSKEAFKTAQADDLDDEL